MSQKPRILITNDDGIHAPGIRHLWEALAEHADITIIAPAQEKSGAGLGITLQSPLFIESVPWAQNTPAWKVTGTPADCVRLGLGTILKAPPDLIVSGINRGANSGRNVLYSGTVGGVIEGALRNIPGIAFSCSDFVNPDYEKTKQWIFPIVKHLLEHPMTQGTLLNVNFPMTEEILGLKLAKQGRGFWVEDLDHRIHPEGSSYYWLGGKWNEHEEDPHSDVHLLKEGFATAVPIHIHELTDLKLFQERKDHFDSVFIK